MPEPDLTAELDAAEDIVTGRVARVETEWGWREPDGSVFGNSLSEAEARVVMRRPAVLGRLGGRPVTLVRRTVTYGPWEAVGGD